MRHFGLPRASHRPYESYGTHPANRGGSGDFVDWYFRRGLLQCLKEARPAQTSPSADFTFSHPGMGAWVTLKSAAILP